MRFECQKEDQNKDQNNKSYKYGLKQQKHKIIKKIISKPILIYMPPNLYSKATINFN